MKSYAAHFTGSEEALALNTSAFRKLEVVAALTSPPLTNSSPANVATDQSSILKSIHTAKDKYIFKCKSYKYIF